MLHALVQFAKLHEADLIPPGYRRMDPIKWVLQVDAEGKARLDPIENEDPRPSTNRSSGVEPLLLADTAEYVLGFAKSEKERDQKRAEAAKAAFWDLVQRAEESTGDASIVGLHKARHALPERPDTMSPKDVIVLRRKDQPLPIRQPAIQSFWARELETRLSQAAGQCGGCGETRPLLRIMPTGIKGFPQDVKLSAINLSSFESYGFSQAENSPLCFDCGMLASSALSHLLEHHKVTLTRDEKSGLSTQYAVFWLKDAQIETPQGPQDLSRLLDIALTGRARSSEASDAEGTDVKSPPSVEEVELLLKVPWKPRDAALATDPNAFHLAILSANVSRLVVRGWFHGSLRELQANLQNYIERTRIVGPWGEEPHSLPLRDLLGVLNAYKVDPERRRWDSNPPPAALTRALLSSAYASTPPPREIVQRAVLTLRNPKAWSVDRLASKLVAAIRFGMTNGAEAMQPTQMLDESRHTQAYLCGRVFAILERAQGIHSKWKLNTTLVERSYGAASTRPNTVFPPLINVATTAHLPKAGSLNVLMDRTMSELQAAGGFPATLTLQQQGDFALGFYQQRAAFRAESNQKKEDEGQ